MSKNADFDALAERLTDPEVPLRGVRVARTGDAASQGRPRVPAARVPLREAIPEAMRRGRPKIGQPKSESPAVRGRLSPDDYATFKQLEKDPGRTTAQSPLLTWPT